MSTPLRIAEPPSVPEIQVGTDLRRMLNESIAALGTDARVYQRGGSLVHVIRADAPPPRAVRRINGRPEIVREEGTPLIASLSHPLIRVHLSDVARWIRYDGRKKTWVATLPAEAVVGAVATVGEWPGIRPLIGVITAPTMRVDGSLLQEPGYDPATGLLYWPNARYPRVDDEPTLDDAIGARDALLDIVHNRDGRGFPFARPEHESSWLAAVLTIVCRPAIDGPTPMFLIDATTRGTGKSKLMDAAVRLACGHDAAKMGQQENEVDWEKALLSVFKEGDAVVAIDNVNGLLASAHLDRALTSSVFKGRELGRTGTITVPMRAVFFANGNNVQLGGDLARRTLHTRLESALENPEHREEFRHPDLPGYISANRHRLVASALTLVRAYVAAGAPATVKPWGSFEAWSALIAGALAWAGMPDPMLARASADEAVDGDKMRIAGLVEGLARLIVPSAGARGFTAKQIIAALYPHGGHDPERPPDGFDELRETIEEITRTAPGRTPDSVRFAHYLKRIRGRVVGGQRIEREAGKAGTMRWYVERVS